MHVLCKPWFFFIQKLQACTLSSPCCQLLGKVTCCHLSYRCRSREGGCHQRWLLCLTSSDLPSSRPLTLLLFPGWEKRELLPYLSHCMFWSFPYSSLPHTTFPGLVLNSRKKAKPHVHRGLIVYTHHLQPMPISPSLSGLPWRECISLP